MSPSNYNSLSYHLDSSFISVCSDCKILYFLLFLKIWIIVNKTNPICLMWGEWFYIIWALEKRRFHLFYFWFDKGEDSIQSHYTYWLKHTISLCYRSQTMMFMRSTGLILQNLSLLLRQKKLEDPLIKFEMLPLGLSCICFLMITGWICYPASS